MKKILLALMVSVSLTGCAAYQMIDLTYRAASNIDPPMPFESTKQIDPVEGQKVYGSNFKPSPLLGQKKCGSKGILVDYVQDWDTINEETGEVIKKAEPDKIYDQAVLIYKLMCEGMPEQAVLLTTDRQAVLWFWKKIKLRDVEVIKARDYFKLSEKGQPKWMTQVIRTIQAEAPTNPAAQDFLDSVKIGEDGLPVKSPPAKPGAYWVSASKAH